MARLFIDDDVQRHLAFARRYPGELQTASLVAAQSELNTTPGHITELWLDHDLGDQLIGGGYFDEATGNAVGFLTCTIRPLIAWMTTTQIVDRDLPIVVHSWNTPAALWMVATLREAGFKNVRRIQFSEAALAEEARG